MSDQHANCLNCKTRADLGRIGTQLSLKCSDCGMSYLLLPRVPEVPAKWDRRFLGQRFNRCQIVSRAAVEEDGAVYEALHFGMDKPVHVKVLSPDLAGDLDIVRRFVQQAQLASRIAHPRVPRILDVDTHHGVPFVVREQSEGQRLSTRLKGKALSTEDVRSLFSNIAETLAAIHESGILHLNIRPHSIILTKDKDIRLVGFCAAVRQKQPQKVIAGTPGYTAPEQVLGKDLSPSTDVFLLGLLLFEMLTGRPAFHADKNLTLFALPAAQDAPSPKTINAAVPQDLSSLTQHMTQRWPEDRIASCADVLRELNPTSQSEPGESLVVEEIAPSAPPPAAPAEPVEEPVAAELEDTPDLQPIEPSTHTPVDPKVPPVAPSSSEIEQQEPVPEIVPPPSESVVVRSAGDAAPSVAPVPTTATETPVPDLELKPQSPAPSKVPERTGELEVVKPGKGKAVAKAAKASAAAPEPVGENGKDKKKKLLIYAGAGGGVILLVVVASFLFSNGNSEQPTPQQPNAKVADAGTPDETKKVRSLQEAKKPEAKAIDTKTATPTEKNQPLRPRLTPKRGTAPDKARVATALPRLDPAERKAIEAAFNKARDAANALSKKRRFGDALTEINKFIKAHPESAPVEDAELLLSDVRKQAEIAFVSVRREAEKHLGRHNYLEAIKAYEDAARIWGIPEQKRAAERAVMKLRYERELLVVSKAGTLLDKISKQIRLSEYDMAQSECDHALAIAKEPALKEWVAGAKADIVHLKDMREIVIKGINRIKGQKMDVQQGTMKIRLKILGADKSGIRYQGASNNTITKDWSNLTPEEMYAFGKRFSAKGSVQHHLAIGTYCLENGLVEEGFREFASAAKIDPANEEWLIERLKRAGTGIAFVPAGPFKAGRNGAAANEQPEHEAKAGPFFITRHEITNAEYQYFIGKTKHPSPSHWPGGTYPKGRGNAPVTNVTWEDARAYAQWLGWRLPEEMEWEKAARGSDGRLYPWGSRFKPSAANVTRTGKGVLKPIRSFPGGLSPFGLVDVCGNAAEWTNSWYKPYKGAKEEDADYGEKYKVIRGGSCADTSDKATCTFRAHKAPTYKDRHIGFRCVWAPVPLLGETPK